MKKTSSKVPEEKNKGKKMPIPFDQLVRTFDSERLSKAYQSLIDKQLRESEPCRKKTLERRISVIKMELRKRYERKEVAGTPKKGLLATMGYHVGEIAGIRTEFRRKLLSEIVEGPILWVGDWAYMSEWGSEGSKTRLHKLKRCLKSFLGNPAHDGKTRAKRDWEADLTWLETEYRLQK